MKLKKATHSIVLYHYKTLASGEHPVKLRITFEGKSHYFGLGLSAAQDNWNEDTCRLVKDKKKVNLILNQKDALAENILLDFERENLDFTFNRFEDRFITSKSPKDLLVFIEQRIGALELENRLSSAHSYKDLMYRLEDFKGGPGITEKRQRYALDKANGKNPPLYRRPVITFHDIADPGFLESFESYLSGTRGNSKNTIGIYLRTLKAVINKAITKGMIRDNMSPFRTGFKIATVKPGKVKSLSHDQMMTLKNFNAMGKQKEDIDLFLFSYYLDGSNLMDIAKLKWANLANGRISFMRSKTDKLLDIDVNEAIAEIVARYHGNGTYIFGILQDGMSEKQIRYRIRDRLKKINHTLQQLATSLELPTDITFYWARHSFAARLYNLGVSVSVISEMMTHGDMRTTKNYIGRLDKTHLDEVRKKL